jgi:hypothetical protein
LTLWRSVSFVCASYRLKLKGHETDECRRIAAGRALRTTGWCFVAVGLITLLARRVLGNYIVDSLVKNASNKDRRPRRVDDRHDDVHDIAVVIVISAQSSSLPPGSPVTRAPARRCGARWRRRCVNRPAVAYTTVFAALLLLVVWVPCPHSASSATSPRSPSCSLSVSTDSAARPPASFQPSNPVMR